ncbi:efflux RND transporter periplasmic adaptor subunit [Flammeovirga aprica]|uniref:Efflux RND transporter periplasmic adaptor subunit n=1 Tax=Flammeovirga aprica JL-4 TaxID=694437 RepID=A0A7X9P3D9_9BACT|nr:efflux RND transporter periplasmic adaptor subunit [Flammeovirga aprica]NME68615.1 efflux RND transporter periplasmic adaptor subunit [Flammeovirga aprica JL-4]
MRHLFLYTILIVFTSCGGEKTQDKQTKDQLVKVVQVKEEGASHSNIATGVSIPQKEVQLSFRVSGPLKTFNLEEGQRVQKGQVLGVIDQRDYKIDLQKAESAFHLAEAAKVRAEKLFKKNNIAEQVYDKAILDFEQASSNLEMAENALKDTKLFAPFTGRVKKLSIEKGEHVTASKTVITLQDFEKTRVRCTVPEEIVKQVNELDKVEIVFDSNPNKKYWAKVIEVLHDTEQLNYAYPMLLEVQHADGQFLAGMTVEVYFNFKNKGETTVILPTNAVMGEANGENFVWSVSPKNKTLHKVNVQLLHLKDDSKVEVKMLGNAEWVVATGGSLLVEGQKVRANIENAMITKN